MLDAIHVCDILYEMDIKTGHYQNQNVTYLLFDNMIRYKIVALSGLVLFLFK